MRAFDSATRQVAYVLATAGLALLFINAIATVLDVLGRALFNAPIDRLSDVSSLIYILAAAFCVPAATAQRRHITIRLFEGRLSSRAEAALDVLAAALLLMASTVLAYQLWRYAAELDTTAQTLSQLRIRVAPFWQIVATAMSFNAMLEALNLIRSASVVIGRIAPDTATQAGSRDATNIL